MLATVGKVRFDKKDRRWAMLEVEDLTASGTAFCFADAYEKYRDVLLPDTPLYMEGRISKPREEDIAEAPEGEEAPPKEIKFMVDKVMLLEEACQLGTDPVCIDIALSDAPPERLDQLKELLLKHKGGVPVHLMLHLGDAWCRMGLAETLSVTPGPALEQDVSAWEQGAT